MISMRSGLRRAVLTHLSMNPNLRTYVRGLARRIGVDPTNLSREMAALQAEGIVTGELEGRQLYYSLNRTPHVKRLLAVLEPDIGVEGTLQHAVEEVPGVETAFLYSGEKRPDPTSSDGDLNLMVIGTMSRKALAAEIHKAELALSRPVRISAHSRKEFDELPKAEKKLMWHVRMVFPKPAPKIEAAAEPVKVRAKQKARGKRRAKG
ncbi:MAG TPA: winged helix-turn-helix domain-containing protein [Terracidiphilus sp.]|nr:winged helix-turn-helix domain-containing protein [Terracidiphilus sp.]